VCGDSLASVIENVFGEEALWVILA
jgi:hypothetical protein